MIKIVLREKGEEKMVKKTGKIAERMKKDGEENDERVK